MQIKSKKGLVLCAIVLLLPSVPAEDSEEKDKEWTIDGIKYSDIPEGFRLAAYMRELAGSEKTECRHKLRASTVVCPTEECMAVMKQYEEWREAHGIGIASGRWGRSVDSLYQRIVQRLAPVSDK